METRTEIYNPSQTPFNQKRKLLAVIVLLMGLLLGLLLSLLFVTPTAPGINLLSPINKIVNSASPQKPVLISHRGEPALYPEHSFAGYRAAIKAGGHFIELDVLLSKDGIAYDSHDDNLLPLYGVNVNISQQNSTYLDSLRRTDGGEPLHRLTSVLNQFKGKTYFVIEAKHVPGEVPGKIESFVSYDINKYKLQDVTILQDSDGPQSIVFNYLLPGTPLLYNFFTPDTNDSDIEKLPSYVRIASIPKDNNYDVFQAVKKRNMKLAVFEVKVYQDNKVFLTGENSFVFSNNTAQSIKFLEQNSIDYY